MLGLHYTALNIQVVADHAGLVTDIVARWPGATHDAFMWENSAVGQRAARGEYGDSVFLGDSVAAIAIVPFAHTY